MTERNKFITGLAILLITVGIGAWQWNETLGLKVATDSLNTQVATLSSLKAALQTSNQNLKIKLNEIRGTSEQKLTSVFPTNEDITELTRLFDDFSVKNNFASNPFFISNINYEGSVNVEEANYRYIPVNIQLTASRKNLNKFIEFIETSGSLESGVRLMSIEDMGITYPSEESNYEANFKIRAYFSQEI